MKLTMVTHNSPISIEWKAFDAAIKRKKKNTWVFFSQHSTGPYLRAAEDSHYSAIFKGCKRVKSWSGYCLPCSFACPLLQPELNFRRHHSTLLFSVLLFNVMLHVITDRSTYEQLDGTRQLMPVAQKVGAWTLSAEYQWKNHWNDSHNPGDCVCLYSVCRGQKTLVRLFRLDCRGLRHLLWSSELANFSLRFYFKSLE